MSWVHSFVVFDGNIDPWVWQLFTEWFLCTNITMTSSNGNIFHVTVPLCREFTGHRWIPLTKASDADLWCFLWSAPWINGWVNNHEAGDLRCHHASCDIVIFSDYGVIMMALQDHGPFWSEAWISKKSPCPCPVHVSKQEFWNMVSDWLLASH